MNVNVWIQTQSSHCLTLSREIVTYREQYALVPQQSINNLVPNLWGLSLKYIRNECIEARPGITASSKEMYLPNLYPCRNVSCNESLTERTFHARSIFASSASLLFMWRNRNMWKNLSRLIILPKVPGDSTSFGSTWSLQWSFMSTRCGQHVRYNKHPITRTSYIILC
jgi:hypothetical protein